MAGTNIKEASPKTEAVAKTPQLYNVLLLNDDFTPRQFVVDVLHLFFFMDEAKAQETMLIAHTQGTASCGVYTMEIAETKVKDVHDYISQYELPLRFTFEPA